MTIPRLDGWWDEIKAPVDQIKEVLNKNRDRQNAVQEGILSGKINPQALANMAAHAPDLFKRLGLGQMGNDITAMGESSASKKDRIMDDATLEGLKDPKTRGEAVSKVLGTKTEGERKIEEQTIKSNDQALEMGGQQVNAGKQKALMDAIKLRETQDEEAKRTRLKPVVESLRSRKVEKDVSDFLDGKLDNTVAEGYQYAPEYKDMWNQLVGLEKQERMLRSQEARAEIRGRKLSSEGKFGVVMQLNSMVDNLRQSMDSMKNVLKTVELSKMEQNLASINTPENLRAKFPAVADKVAQRDQILVQLKIAEKRLKVAETQHQIMLDEFLPAGVKFNELLGGGQFENVQGGASTTAVAPQNTASATPPATPASPSGQAPLSEEDKRKKRADKYRELVADPKHKGLTKQQIMKLVETEIP
jgi:hypothetical protein